MPVEIKELIIRANIMNGCEENSEVKTEVGSDEDRTAIIAACVEQVLKILERKKER